MDRLNKELETKLLRRYATLLGIPATPGVRTMKGHAERELDRQIKRYDAGHWSYDANRTIALRQFIQSAKEILE